MTAWRALILAGSRQGGDPVAAAAGVAFKAFAPVAGRPMLEHVVEALRGDPRIGEIAVSLPAEAPPPPPGSTRLEAGGGPAASALAAFDALGPPLLVTTANHPLLTAGMIGDFLDAAEASGADAVAGLCPRATAERAGNPARRTWLRFADGEASGCNLFALAAPEARGAVALWRALESDRKRPWRMARRIGPGLLLRHLLGRLDRAGAARALGRRAGCRAALVLVDHPDAPHDVDAPADLAFVERRLAERARGA